MSTTPDAGGRTTGRRCFACDRKLGRNPAVADTRDDQLVLVGSECAKKIYAKNLPHGEEGWQPPKGGPKLYPLPRQPWTRELQERVALAHSTKGAR